MGSEDAERYIVEDWDRDRRGAEGLNRQMLMDALFELADIWTDGINASKYAHFLQKLFDKVAVVFEKLAKEGGVLWRGHIWRGVDECSYDPSSFPAGVGTKMDDATSVKSGQSGRSVCRAASPEGRRGQLRAQKARGRAATKIQAVVRVKIAIGRAKKRDQAASKIGAVAKGRVTRRALGRACESDPGLSTVIRPIRRARVAQHGFLYTNNLSTPGTRGTMQPWALRPVDIPEPPILCRR